MQTTGHSVSGMAMPRTTVRPKPSKPLPANTFPDDDDERIADIKRRLAAATPGPWHAVGTSVWGPPGSGAALWGREQVGPDGKSYGPIAELDDDEYVSSKRAKQDARLIAYARDDLEWLLAEVARLRAMVAEA